MPGPAATRVRCQLLAGGKHAPAFGGRQTERTLSAANMQVSQVKPIGQPSSWQSPSPTHSPTYAISTPATSASHGLP